MFRYFPNTTAKYKQTDAIGIGACSVWIAGLFDRVLDENEIDLRHRALNEYIFWFIQLLVHIGH